MDGFSEFVGVIGKVVDRLTEFSGEFVVAAVDAAISSLPLFLIVGVITFAGRQSLSARTRFALWSLVLIRMILPFSLETPFGMGMWTNRLPVISNAPVGTANDVSAEMPIPTFREPQIENVVAAPEPTLFDYRWQYLVGIVLIFGATPISVTMAIWFLITSIRTSRRIRRGIDPENAAWTELLNQSRRQFGIRVPVRLRRVQNWSTPATMGMFRPTIILPDDAHTLSVAELQHVIWHEMAHIKRGDAAWSFLWIAARCLQWWNPCFWWTQRCWLAERELACDALVMQHLGSAVASDYGRTLIRFLERLSGSAGSPGSIPLPGLVMLLGDKGAIRRRLEALAHPTAIETTWFRWCSVGLLTVLAMAGLTDAAAPKAKEYIPESVMVPAGTTWQFGPESADTKDSVHEPTITRTYDISGALAGIRKDQPNADAEHSIREFLQPYAGIFPANDGKPQSAHSQITDDLLTITATEPHHRVIQTLLNHWQQFGQQQITVEVKFCSTLKELSDFLPATGGKIVSPSPMREIDILEPSKSHQDLNNSLSDPSFVCTLSPQEHSVAMQTLYGDRRVSHLFAPKITLFSGCSASIQDTTQRPFVTGLRTTGSGTREGQVSKITEGVQVGLKSTLLDTAQNIQLDLHLRLSELSDVEVLKARSPDQVEDAAIQIPHLREMNLKTSMMVASGNTLLISPLRRDKQGKLQVYLITPRLIYAP